MQQKKKKTWSEKSSAPSKNTHRGRPSRPANGKKSKPVKSIDPKFFTKKAISREQEESYRPQRKISEYPVHPALVQNLIKKGFEYPTEIQDRSLDALLGEKDLLGIAQTGTGKTAAFLVPLIHKLMGQKAANQVLIIVPTRELAVQVEQEFRSITKNLNLFCTCFIGGTNINKDLSALRRPSHFIIGTPGRLNDLGRQRALDFTRFNTLVLDEFDRLLDMGFLKDIQRMVQSMTNRRHTLLFSATEEKNQATLIAELLNEPVKVRVSDGSSTGDHIDQEIVKVSEGENKYDVLLNMLRNPDFSKVLVFAETKRGVSNLHKKLVREGLKVEQIHGNKSQNYRLNALQQFKQGKVSVLLATDVAARGLDISEVSHVINFQAPRSLDAYIHRIGRTGRAGKSGKAYTFIN